MFVAHSIWLFARITGGSADRGRIRPAVAPAELLQESLRAALANLEASSTKTRSSPSTGSYLVCAPHYCRQFFIWEKY